MCRGCKIALVLIAGVIAFSCKPSAERSRIELTTVDVQPEIDVALTTAYDETAVVHGDGLSGVLPGDFPRDIPLYMPSSLIDMGSSKTGRPFIVLATPDGREKVYRSLADKLTNAGWSVVDTESSELEIFGRESRRVWIRVQTSGALTEILVEYEPHQ